MYFNTYLSLRTLSQCPNQFRYSNDTPWLLKATVELVNQSTVWDIRYFELVDANLTDDFLNLTIDLEINRYLSAGKTDSSFEIIVEDFQA
ncbi:hypothetical protein PoB_003212900 [Plakobranchus ocellatus]|uniref:Uncharacterized protein n=1 Tax=Plakobranchus ocellatus TaxID=259542 RepID=A0AAV4AHA0_9GAST|nr:hypothetical protein PoB_003212900 [Plakobranchus ocellatus]